MRGVARLSRATTGEPASLYVDPSHENQGIGRKLIQFAESKARELGLNELIALSTRTFTYFQSKGGFAEGCSATHFIDHWFR